ncbi:hypothetical protein SAMN05216167_101507 [Spirosoma endophyticum]|uniref:Uncharacterized protein n=1 Tax=Spirosoma endophyticum TaxID=662367 RepID=A0A1I1GLY9_9BACT|nr:hypothetical protein SAMN05216167_101507 [Spirosoma endophyticum]
MNKTLTLNQPESSILKCMAEDKETVEAYFKNGDKSEKPEGIRFVKPISVRPRRK